MARLLVHDGYKVTFVTNITDVNDKIYAAAQTADVGSELLAREMSDAYVADIDRLGLGRPDHEPRASATIAEIVELIEELIESRYAYPVDGDVVSRYLIREVGNDPSKDRGTQIHLGPPESQGGGGAAP